MQSNDMIEQMTTIEKITKYINSPVMTKVCSTMTKDEHVNSMANIIREINTEKDAKFLAEIIHKLQRQVFEFENKKWKIRR